MKENLLNKVWLRVAMIVAVVTTTFAGTAQAADEIYKTALFGESYNSGPVTNYTSNWTATNAGFTVSLANFANASSYTIPLIDYEIITDRWSYIACGRNNAASTANITTAAPIDKPVTKVSVNISQLSSAGQVNSIILQTSADYATWTDAGTFTKATGTQTVEIPADKQAANLFYRIVFNCARGTEGNVHVTRVDYYREADDPNAVATPVISGTQVFNPSTSVTITCGTSDATIWYSTDHGVSWTEYTGAISLTKTTTITAKATKEGMNESEIVNKSFCHSGDVEDVTWNLKTGPTGGTPTNNLATWTKDAQGEDTGAVMSLTKGGSGNNVNAHIGQSDGTYFYNGQILRIAPLEGYTIVSVEITVSSNSGATGIRGSNWTNATATASGSKVTVTPDDGTLPLSVVSSAGYNTNLAGAIESEKYYTITGVKVEYAPTTSPYIATEGVINATSEGASGTMEVVYNKVDNTNAEVVVVDGEGNEVDWLTATLTLDEYKNIEYTIDANTTTEARTAYMVVKVDNLYSPAITVTQEAAPYSLANEADNTSLIDELNGETVDVKLANRTLSGNNTWNSLCLPFDVTLADSPLAGADVRTLTGGTIEGTILHLHFTPAGTIKELEAGKPYIVRFAGSSIVEPIFTNVTVDNSVNDIECSLDDGITITFKGTYKRLDSFESPRSILYMGGDNKLYYPGSATYIGSQRAYFQLGGITIAASSQGSGIKGFQLYFDEDPTGIENVNGNLNLNDEPIYNIAGQRINKMQRGINIINGKKILK